MKLRSVTVLRRSPSEFTAHVVLEPREAGRLRAVDPFVAVVFGAIVVLGAVLWLVGRYYPGSGLEQLGLRSAREITEQREALEAEDLQQMLGAHNDRRKARGLADVTADDMELRVAAERREQERRREALLADRELDQLLDATNRRRRARGLPERTPEQAREEFGEPPAPEP